MAAKKKILWVVNYNTLSSFLAKAVAVGATGVAIRTDNDVAKAILAFHKQGIKVYGWRWPSSHRDPAMKEAMKAVALFAAGMDGYFVDPEGAKGKPYDWDQPNLSKLAEDFCSTITKAAPGKPFGTTSHYRAKAVFANLPWASFFKYSSVLLPQAYWRCDAGTIGHGIPQDNYRVALQFWQQAGGRKEKIVPMAGELACATGAEITQYVAEAKAQKIDTLHFYTYGSGVKADVWDAIAKA